MITIVLLSLAGAVIAAVIGTLWYLPATPMGKIHMQFLGFDKLSPEEQKAKMESSKSYMPQLYAAQMFLSLLTAFAVVTIITMSIQNGVPFSYAIGFVVFNWLCFVVPTMGAGVLWSNCERSLAWKHFISDALCNLLTLVVVGILASLFV